MKQIVRNEKMTPLKGVGLIAALVAFLLLLNYVLTGFAARLVGSTVSTILFWLCGAVVALWMLRNFVVAYSYELTNDLLRICRKYGKRERFIADIYLNRLRFVGTLEEAKSRYPNAKGSFKAVHPRSDLQTTALVYEDSDGLKLAKLQASDELKAALRPYAKRK